MILAPFFLWGVEQVFLEPNAAGRIYSESMADSSFKPVVLDAPLESGEGAWVFTLDGSERGSGESMPPSTARADAEERPRR